MIGEKIYEMRRSKNMSQENLADVLGVTRQTVSKWETNQSLPDLDKVIPLCKVFEISVEELLGTVSGAAVNRAEVDSGNVKFESGKPKIEIDDAAEKPKDTADGNEFESGMPKIKIDDAKEKFRKRSAAVVSGAVFAYIADVAFLIVAVAAWGWNPITVISIFLVIAGAATAAIIWNFMSMPKTQKEEKPIAKSDKLSSQINRIIWTAAIVLYFLVSFPTGAWYITWLIFIIAVLCTQIMRLVFSLSEQGKDDGKNAEKSENERRAE